MIGRMLRSADFERVLGTPSRARSSHFAVHYLRAVPSRAVKPQKKGLVPELSTGAAPTLGVAVDDSVPDQVWLGLVVPKRHARRAATRNLIKRQIRSVMGLTDQDTGLPQGLWVVRLRAPFDRKTFTSPASDALRSAAAEELHSVLAQAARRASV
jgi:ribonuclease P protein component